jgi:hypothetical protein
MAAHATEGGARSQEVCLHPDRIFAIYPFVLASAREEYPSMTGAPTENSLR